MPEYLSPGVYVEEISVGPKPIEGVATSNLGIVGPTERGPLEVRLVSSWLEFQRTYGNPIPGSHLAHAVRGFFDNGGKRCFVARAVGGGAGTAEKQVGNLRLVAAGPGVWGARILVRISEASQAGSDGDQFKVTLLYYADGLPDTLPDEFVDPTIAGAQAETGFRAPTATEVYDNVTHREEAPNEVVKTLSASNLIWAEWTGARAQPPMGPNYGVLGGLLRLTKHDAPHKPGDILVRIDDATGNGADEFRLRVVYYDSGAPEGFDFDAADPTGTPEGETVLDNLTVAGAEPEDTINAVADEDRIVDAVWLGERRRPRNTDGWTLLSGRAFEALSSGGNGAALGPSDFEGSEQTETRKGKPYSYATGLLGLERVDEISLLAAPDEHDHAPALRSAVINQCERLADRFAVLAAPPNTRRVTGLQPNPPTSYGALYWPWIFTQHPTRDEQILVPPVGHMAGIMARTDVERGVHKPPANAVVRGAFNLEFAVTRAQQDMLNPRGINVIRDFRPDGRGIRLWGARTMSADPEWKYVNVRRLFLFLEESIEEGTQWVVFEPNSEALWDRVRRSIENFLLTVWRNGALMGTSPEQAFYVKCDRSTMTQDDIDNGRLICYIGVAPVKPAEFVVFRIHQWVLGAKTAV